MRITLTFDAPGSGDDSAEGEAIAAVLEQEARRFRAGGTFFADDGTYPVTGPDGTTIGSYEARDVSGMEGEENLWELLFPSIT